MLLDEQCIPVDRDSTPQVWRSDDGIMDLYVQDRDLGMMLGQGYTIEECAANLEPL